MAEKGFAGRAMNAAHHIKALKDIIKALLQGGWASAGLQVLKHYWPQVLVIVCVLLLLPVILICMLPMTLFGFAGSSDSGIAQMNAQAGEVSAYFDTYETDYEARIEELKEELQTYVDSGYSDSSIGTQLPKNRFIALFSVSVGNDFTAVTKEQVKEFLKECIVLEITEENEQSEGTVILKRLSDEEIMERLKFTESDRSWAEMLYNTLETEGNYGE